MLEEFRNIKRDKKDIRKFAITVGIVLVILGIVLFWKDKTVYKYLWLISAFLIVTGIGIPVILKPLYFIWMGFAVIMGWIMSRVILSVLFYIIFTPIGLISRLFGKQFLDLHWDKTAPSYWNYRDANSTDTDRYEKQF